MQVKSLPSPVARVIAKPSAAGAGTGAGRHVSQHLRATSLNRALEVVGDWWTQRILRESFLGVRHFDAYQRHLEIPRQTLSVRLKDLVKHGILDASGGGYRLTPRGLALYPWALMIWSWSRQWGGAAGPRHPAQLVHADCGRPTRPVFACAACKAAVALRDVSYEEAPDARRAPLQAVHHGRRWTGDKAVMGALEAGHNVAFVTADRWTHLIISAVFLGCRTFDVLQREIGISSNILSQRLALLVDAGFLVKRRSAVDARRFVYGLTPRSRDVFPLTITLVEWADRWLGAGRTPPMTRRHGTCGEPLHTLVACSACGAELLPRRVSFEPLPEPPARA